MYYICDSRLVFFWVIAIWEIWKKNKIRTIFMMIFVIVISSETGDAEKYPSILTEISNICHLVSILVPIVNYFLNVNVSYSILNESISEFCVHQAEITNTNTISNVSKIIRTDFCKCSLWSTIIDRNHSSIFCISDHYRSWRIPTKYFPIILTHLSVLLLDFPFLCAHISLKVWIFEVITLTMNQSKTTTIIHKIIIILGNWFR